MEFVPSNVLGTNHVPSPAEREVIQSFILLYQERSLVLNAEIKRAEEILHNLQLEQQVQRDLLGAHEALLTPMRRLIPDLLLEIFHHCHSEAQETPMRLAHVCRQWRELALKTPTLWTFFKLHATLPTSRIVPFARACVERSRSCDLRITINLMNKRQDTQRVRRAVLEALQILARHFHRWRSFEAIMDKVYKPEDRDIIVTTTPRLQRLVWIVHDSQTPVPFPLPPNLHHLHLSTLHSLDIPSILQCTELRSFITGSSSGALTLDECWKILSNCPFLETFDVSSIKVSQSEFMDKGPITLPYLRELRIGPFVPDPAALIYCLNAPSLTTLRILIGKSMEFNSSCVLHLVDHVRPPLTSLSLVNANSADVASCLPLLPHLKSLLLQQASAVDFVILQLLEQNESGHFVCSQLRRLGLRLCLFSGPRLIELAKARREMMGGFRILTGNKAPSRHREEEFDGFTIELHLVGEFSDAELEELCGLETIDEGEAGDD